MTELRAQDLALRLDETETLFRSQVRLDWSDSDIEGLHERTEGCDPPFVRYIWAADTMTG